MIVNSRLTLTVILLCLVGNAAVTNYVTPTTPILADFNAGYADNQLTAVRDGIPNTYFVSSTNTIG